MYNVTINDVLEHLLTQKSVHEILGYKGRF